MDANPWGRVDEHGTVSVLEGESWREVGQYPDATPEEALAYFERKFLDLEGQVRLLEQRAKRGAPANDVRKAADHLREQVTGANAVGDLASLLARLEVLGAELATLTEAQQAEAKAEVDKAIAARETIVASAEALAAKDFTNVQWKQLTADFDALFQQWQSHQKDGPRIPKSAGDALWRRFRDARHTVEQARRQYFSGVDAAHKDARTKKQALIERAQALAPKGSDGIATYRGLLEEWKAAGRAGRKVDDALWADFKAAGDVLYAEKAKAIEAENAEYSENLVIKEAILADAAPILSMQDRNKARELLSSIQQRWDAAGRVPREALRRIEDELRKIEQHVRSLEDAHWERTNPERKARSAGLAGQLEDSIATLEDDLKAAQATKNAKRVQDIEAELAAKREWLKIALAAG